MTRRRWRITLLAALATLSAIYPITSLFSESDVAAAGVLRHRPVGRARARRHADSPARGCSSSSPRCSSSATSCSPARPATTFAWLVPDAGELEVANSLGLQALETIQPLLRARAAQRGHHLLPPRGGRARRDLRRCHGGHLAQPRGRRAPAAHGIPHHGGQRAGGARTALLRRARRAVAASCCTRRRAPASAGGARPTRPRTARSTRPPTTARPCAPSPSGRSSSAPSASCSPLVVPAVVPHFPPRYLTEGLGRAEGGGGEGSVGLQRHPRPRRSLNNSDQTPVLSYTTTAFTKARSACSRRRTTPAGSGCSSAAATARTARAAAAAGQATRLRHQRHRQHPRRAAHRRALPRRGRGDGGHAVERSTPSRATCGSGAPSSTYRVTYADLAPSPPQLRESGAPDSPDITDDDLDRARHGRATSCSAGPTRSPRGKDNPLDRRSRSRTTCATPSRYTYSLDLGEPLRDEPGPPARADPELLRDPSRLLRAVRDGDDHDGAGAGHPGPHGDRLPARAALGLSTTSSGRATPTPGPSSTSRATAGCASSRPRAPAPALHRRMPCSAAAPAPTGGGRRSPSRGSTGASTGRPSPTTTRRPPRRCRSSRASSPRSARLFTLRNVVLVVAVLVGLLAAFAMPITAWLLRWRRRRRGRHPAGPHRGRVGRPHLAPRRPGHRRPGGRDAAPAARALRRRAAISTRRTPPRCGGSRPPWRSRATTGPSARRRRRRPGCTTTSGRSGVRWGAHVPGRPGRGPSSGPQAGVSFWRSLPDRLLPRRR